MDESKTTCRRAARFFSYSLPWSCGLAFGASQLVRLALLRSADSDYRHGWAALALR